MEVLCQGSESLFLKSPWYGTACPQVVEKALAHVQTEPALEDLDKVFKMFSPSQFLKILKPWEISLIAKRKIKWNQPPFERLMSSSSLEKRPHFSFVKIQGDITSWSHATQTFPCYSQLRGSLPSQMSFFHSQSCLTLFVRWIPMPSARDLWERGAEEAKGMHSWPRGPYLHSLQQALHSLQQPRRRPPRPNPAFVQCCQHWILGAVEPGRATGAISFFPGWDSLWWLT